MDKKHIALIKIGGPAFTKKWWDKHRGVTISDSGVGKALLRWAESCPRDPELIEDGLKIQDALAVCAQLHGALVRAKASCGPLAKESKLACDRYMALVTDYRKRLMSAVSEQNADRTLWQQVSKAIEGAVNELNAVDRRLAEATKYAGDLAQYARTLTERAKASNKPGAGGRREELVRAALELRKQFDKWDDLAKRQLTGLKRLGQPVDDLAAGLRTREHEKALFAFHERLRKTCRDELTLREALATLAGAVQETESTVSHTRKAADDVMKKLQEHHKQFWADTGAGALAKKIAALSKRMTEISALDVAALDEADKRTLAKEMRTADARRAEVLGDLADLADRIRETAQDTRELSNDAKVAATLKEMMAAHRQLKGDARMLDGHFAKAAQVLASA